jgi:PAS domain S-box-containing protein
MGALMRLRDWSETPLGPFEQWPQSLKTSVSTCLSSRFAILVWWGNDLVMLYNDAYLPVIGNKHPNALGAAGRKVWPEIWHIIGPMLEGVMSRGEATWSDNLLLELERDGYPEECYFTFSYSPIRDESGGVGGIFTPVQETTGQVIGERRLRTLRDLAEAARASNARSVEEVCIISADTLGRNPHDIPFAAFYLFDEAGFNPASARLTARTGFDAASALTPPLVLPDESDWIFASVLRANNAQVIALPSDLDGIPRGAWPVPPRQAMVLPLAPGGQHRGGLILGISPRKRLDDDYRSFFSLLAGHVSTALAEARAIEQERNRAQALAELDRAKTAFFSNVSHEFRTPLTLMLGPLEELLAAGANLPPSAADLVTVTYRNGLRLQKLVNTLLEFSRIEAGRVQASYEPTDLAKLTSELASAFETVMDKAGLRFHVECAPLPEPVYVDQEMWEKVVLNLLSNALKYTFEGEVTVRLTTDSKAAVLCVEDSGTGIPEEHLPFLFERFHRVEGARGRTQEGTGIGLALVSELSKLHGGTVAVSSTPGRGSIFTVSIPFGSAHLPSDRIRAPRTLASTAVRAESFVGEAARWLPDSPAAANPFDAPFFISDSTPAQDRISDRRILIADDNADMRGYLARLLSGRYKVEVVANGEEALASALDRPPDLVLSDVMMPRMDGFALMRALRADPRTSTLPVILLSARAGEEARVEGLDEGATDYLVKPFTARELLARVGAHLEIASMRRRAAQRESDLRAEAELARDRVLAILESITDGFFTLDSNWCFTYANTAGQRLLGRPLAELLGRNHWELYPAAVGAVTDREYHRAIREQVPVEFEVLYEAWQRWFAVRAYPTDAGGLSVYFRDITEHKLAGQTARESEQRIRAMSDLARSVVEASPYAVEVLDPEGNTLLINQLGRRLRPKNLRWMEFWNESHRARAEECFATVLAGHPAHFAVSTAQPGGAVSWFDLSLTPLTGDDGQVSRVLVITRDVTAARKAEEDLRQIAKLESLGVMAGGVAHDFNNLLTGILGNASLLVDSVSDGDRGLAEDIVLASERAADLTRQMLAFAGKGRFEVSRTDVSKLVREILRLVRPSIERNVEISLKLEDHCIVEGDAGQLQQVIMNLLINAGEAMEGRPGLIVVRTGKLMADRTYLSQAVGLGDAAEGEYVFLEVSDNGEGMDEKTKSKIFDPFFTTKFTGRGLGLAAVSGIVRGHKGMLYVYSEAGRGTTFRVLFPRADAVQVLPATSERPRTNAEGVVLLVDDEAIVRRLGSEVLKRHGYDVRLASDGREALELFRSNFREIDVVVLDMVMPVMGGETALREIREISAEVPVIVCSGYNEVEVIRRFTTQKVAAFLQKPYSATQLLEKIQVILHDSGAGSRPAGRES